MSTPVEPRAPSHSALSKHDNEEGPMLSGAGPQWARGTVVGDEVVKVPRPDRGIFKGQGKKHTFKSQCSGKLMDIVNRRLL